MNSVIIKCLLLLFIGNALFAQSSKDVRREIDKIIKYDTEITFDNTPGFIIGIIDEDSTYILPYGSLSLNIDTQITPTTRFQLGSLTKVFVASLVGKLVSDGELSYTDSLGNFFAQCANSDLNSLTIQDLLTHNSSFAKTPSNLGEMQDNARNPYGQYSEDKLMEYVCDYQHKSGRKFNYSHVNYALLTLIISKQLQQPFIDVMNNYVANDLDLLNTYAGGDSMNNRLCTGHDRGGRKTDPWTFNTFEGSEGMVSDMNDLLTYGKMHLETDQFIGDYKRQLQTHYHEQIFAGRAWHIFNYRKYPFYSHSGKAGGHYAFMAFVRATRTGVVILANGTKGTEDLGLLILRMINKNWRKKALISTTDGKE